MSRTSGHSTESPPVRSLSERAASASYPNCSTEPGERRQEPNEIRRSPDASSVLICDGGNPLPLSGQTVSPSATTS